MKLLDKPFFKSRVKSDKVNFFEMIFGYFLGPLGALLSSGIFTSFLNKYFTDFVFVSENLSQEEVNAVKVFLSLLPLISTALIILGNLLCGRLIDRTRSKAGKARPYILLSSITLSIACIIIFITPFNNLVLKMIWIAISYNVYYAFAYPLYNTSNSALIPVSTRDSKSRSLLASFNNIAGLAVMGAGSMIFPIIVSTLLKTNIAWTITFIIVGVITFGCSLLQFLFTRERVTEETYSDSIKEDASKKDVVPLKSHLQSCLKDKQWWLIIVFYLIFQVSGMIKNISMVYFCENIIDNSFWNAGADGYGMTQTLIGVLGAVPMAVASFLVLPIANKIGKKNIVIIGLFLGVLGGVISIIAPTNLVVVSIGVALKCLGSAPACYLILALISDVIDHLEYKNGFRSDGFTMSIYSSILTGATGIGTAIFNGILSVNGYVGGSASQSASAKFAIEFSYLWVETIGFAICAIILIFFSVEKILKKHKTQAKVE